MAFPHDDPAWAETAAFLRARLAPADRVLAPDPFRWAIPRAERFGGAAGTAPRDVAWVVVHKGELDRIPRPLLDALPDQARPVYANPVFVVFASRPAEDLPDLTETDHVRAFAANHATLPPAPLPVLALVDLAEPPAAPPPPPPPLARPVPPRQAPRPQRPPPRPATAPPRPWLVAGQPGPAREAAFQAELDRLIAAYLGSATGQAVLDIGCGTGRLGTLLEGAARVAGIDLDPAALAAARTRHAGLPHFGFARMDAARLAFAESSFDAALLVDTIEMLADPAAALAEAARVLARGGLLLLSAVNRDSLYLRALRRLGGSPPAAGHTAEELAGMLRAVGMQVVRSDGCFLSPAWALPGAAPGLAALEEDPEFIETARRLGRRAGPEDALAFVLLARKG
ncbi:class I SAM-dependent methyltransferase [Falsiroseomonas selenitidurans]|uniref:Class I SAM-dependent methyltransferase n=1 Tax=Falsiroseomonas selenitidurans TaxID=2716335 RepID=A0ABX1E5J8_9PROT|nr:methyltransferase domain-containing protein [Falsiroseomonas selenitidurans]NKC32454.1 class I SAM-dependent methyltransferase [Falsiroseomonas selenitidurans]